MATPTDREPAISNPETQEVPKPNESTLLARQRTTLALERSFLAVERTLMAWLRTSLSMISFGFTLAKFFQYLEGQQGGTPIIGRLGGTWSPRAVGTAMVLIGTGALIAAVVQHRRRVSALQREGLPRQWNLAYWVALILAGLGAFALLSLVLDK